MKRAISKKEDGNMSVGSLDILIHSLLRAKATLSTSVCFEMWTEFDEYEMYAAYESLREAVDIAMKRIDDAFDELKEVNPEMTIKYKEIG